MANKGLSNGSNDANGTLSNGNGAHATDDQLVASSPSSPRTIRFENLFTNGHPRAPVSEGSPITVTDRPRIPERSLSNTSFSGDSKSANIDPHPLECSDHDCAFGWTTYVLNHACKVPQTSQKKVSIHRLLHEEEDNPLLKPYEKDSIRYVHLPANNMTWVEDLIKRYYYEHPGDKQLRLLRRDFWYGQQHGKSGPVHARFMRPRCDIVPGDLDASSSSSKPKATTQGDSKTTTHTDFVISMPYLHWEYDANREKMRRIIANVQKRDLHLSESGKKWMRIARKTAEPDEKLLRKYLLNERPVHIRRTLDQSYYWTLKDTQTRDIDQVVYRATAKPGKNMEDVKRVVMVDQLWLWILDGKLVISSFPRRWAGTPGGNNSDGRNKSDASGLFRTVRERLDDRPNLDNVYDLATLLIDQCSRVFFDRTVPKDNRPEVIDIFANAIGDVTNRSTQAWKKFWNSITPNSRRYREMISKNPWGITVNSGQRIKDEEEINHQRLLDINPEGELLREIKDILDELHMIMKVYNEQHAVASDFSAHIQQIGGRNKEVKEKTKNQALRLVKEISRRKGEIHELTRAADRTADGLRELLDLKQKHANVSEARAAVQRADEANEILAYTSQLAAEAAEQTEQGVKQAEESSKQNRSLMIFTIVTIIFLPLSFISSVFGMNAPEFGQGQFHIWKQFLIMFPVSIMIILFSLALALSEDFLAVCGTYIKLKWANLLKKLGLFERWKKKGEHVRMVIERRNAELDKLYQVGTAGPQNV